jgi:fructosamine-3-kinase
MLYGEFHSMTAIHNAMPDIAPQPIGHGTYQEDRDTHFFLCGFHNMLAHTHLPDSKLFPDALAQLHKRGISPNGKFGFHVTTYQGRLPQNTSECDTWEESFSNGIEQFFKAEEEAQGFDEEMAVLKKGIMEKVIPRLLRPLETGGNTIKPCLVHGDLWDGNTSVDAETGKSLIFDACSSYAHHECEPQSRITNSIKDSDNIPFIIDELAPWRPVRHLIRTPYVVEYLNHFPASKPEADFDDRNALYCV